MKREFRRARVFAAWVGAMSIFPASVGYARVLYDGNLSATPSEQGLLYLSQPSGPGHAALIPVQGGTRVDTLGVRGDKAGFFGDAGGQPLEREPGFAVELELGLAAEYHASPDRAGLSVIVLSHDLRGIELGFWRDRVWAQSDQPLFQQAEGAVLDWAIGSPRRHLRLEIAGDGYTARVDGTAVLSGRLRNYSAFGFPYAVPDLLFVGDDTGSAAADWSLFRWALPQ